MCWFLVGLVIWSKKVRKFFADIPFFENYLAAISKIRKSQ